MKKNLDEFFSLNEIWQWWIDLFFWLEMGDVISSFTSFMSFICVFLFHDNHYGTKKSKSSLKRRLWRKVVIGVLINLSYNFARKKNAPQCLMNNCHASFFFLAKLKLTKWVKTHAHTCMLKVEIFIKNSDEI